MNSNYEAVVSLIELLVKKAGFDITKDYSESELKKTKDSIASLNRQKVSSKDKKGLQSAIDSLKVRQANWENNAEIVGKSLIKAYEEGKDYPSVKARIELLGNLALKGTEDISVGHVYDKLKNLNSDYKDIQNKIKTTDYRNESEKEMDTKLKVYLENRLSSLEIEISSLVSELENLKEEELKNVNIVAKIKEYIVKLSKDTERIDKVVSSSINSDIAFDVWERLEKAKNTTSEKLSKAEDLLKKTEETLGSVRNNRNRINERKDALTNEQERNKIKLKNISAKLEEDNYENSAEKMIDLNSSEIMKLEIEALSNKKDVIYVDAIKVKEELIREWQKEHAPIVKIPKEEETQVLDEVLEKIEDKSIDEELKEVEDLINDNVPSVEEFLSEELPEEILETKHEKENEVKEQKTNIIKEAEKIVEEAPVITKVNTGKKSGNKFRDKMLEKEKTEETHSQSESDLEKTIVIDSFKKEIDKVLKEENKAPSDEGVSEKIDEVLEESNGSEEVTLDLKKNKKIELDW